MKQYFIDNITSKVLKRNAIDWVLNKLPAKLNILEEINNEIVNTYDPKIITVFIPSNNISQIDFLNNLGYKFIQCRLNVEREVIPKFINSYPFQLKKVTTIEELNRTLSFCDKIKFDDRYSIDKEIDKRFSKIRIKDFIKNSFDANNEYIYMLENNYRGTIHGFRSFRLCRNKRAKMLLTGVSDEYTPFNFAKVINGLELYEMSNLNIRVVESVISINNHDEINRYLSKYNYKVVNTYMVLRKLF